MRRRLASLLPLVVSALCLTADEIEAQRSGWNLNPNTQYHIQTDEGPERFFRFQTSNGQYRKEKRLADGTVIGTEGWLDPLGYLRLKDYIADHEGFRILRSKMVYVGKDRPIQDAVAEAKKVPAQTGVLTRPRRPPNPFRRPDPNAIVPISDQRLRHSKGSLDVLYFKFSDKVVQHRVTRAELSLWVWGVNQEASELGEPIDLEGQDAGPVTITLQRILRGTTETGGPLLGPPLTTKHPRPFGRRGGWITIELRRMVAEWFKHPRDNLGVALKITGPGGNHRRNSARLVETNPGAEYAPYLEVQMQELDSRRNSRIKRNVGLNCDEASQETRCCRYKLTVDFEKFGWDWIIAPKKYDANYCSGDCPMAFLPAYPNTHIVSLAEPPNNTGPCCAPRKLSEITMLYFDNEYQIVFSRLPGMVVEKCGCS